MAAFCDVISIALSVIYMLNQKSINLGVRYILEDKLNRLFGYAGSNFIFLFITYRKKITKIIILV